MPAAVALEANACFSSRDWRCGTGPYREQQQVVKTGLTMQEHDLLQMAGVANGSASAALCGANRATSSCMTQLLQQGIPPIASLESVLKQELNDLASSEHKLTLLRQLLQKQHQPNGATGVLQSPQREGNRSSQLQQQPIRVMPLLGLTLAQLVAHLQQHAQQQPQQGSTALGTSTPDVTPEALLQPGNNPLTSAMGGDSSSPFLLALHVEVQRVRNLISTCYAILEEEVAAIGQHLPPAVDTDSSSGDADGKGKGRKKRISTNSSLNDPAAKRASAEAAAAPMGSETPLSMPGAAPALPLAPAYGTGLDLELLQKRAAAVSFNLVQLDDFIVSSTAQLARLALQYDTLLTAAATEGTTNGSSTTAAAANIQARSNSLLGLLNRKQQAKHEQQQQQSSQQDVEFLLMTPGVCSHSSPHQQSKYTAGVPPDIYHQAVRKLVAGGGRSEPTLWGLSVVYARLHHAAETAHAAQMAGAEPMEWTAPDQFMRSTTKYWVHPSQIMRLKLALLQHLPVLVYGAADPVYRGDISSRDALAAGSGGVTSLVSSVYFDSPTLDVFHTRLAREDGARLVRMRYYGPRKTGPLGESQAVFVERKTHREKWTGERSVKERASLTQGQVPAFLAGQLTPSDDMKQNKEQLLQQVHEFLTAWEQAPAVRTEYLRTAFQRYDSNSVRLSLDEHMLLLRERGQPRRPGDWCADLESHAQLSGNDAVRFPYGILEIKLQEEAPAWVKELKASGVLVPVQKFSKFLHGMALLYPEQVARNPSWFTWDEAAGCAAPASLDEARAMAEERSAMKQQEKAAWQAAHEAAGILPSGSSPNSGSPKATAAAAAPAGFSDHAPPGLMLPTLAPLRIPCLHSYGPGGAAALPTAAATPVAYSAVAAAAVTAAAPDLMSAVVQHPKTNAAQYNSSTLMSSVSLSEYTMLQHLQQEGGVLLGAGLHTPVAGSVVNAAVAFSGGGSRGGSCLGGGSGPFNAGINDSIRPHGCSHSDTSSASDSSSYKAAQAAAAQRGAFSSNSAMSSRSGNAGAHGDGRLPLDNNSFDQHPLLDASSNKLSGRLSSTAGANEAEVSGSSPHSTTSGGIRRFMGFMMGGRKGRLSYSEEGAQDSGREGALAQQHSQGLEVTHPLDLLCARPPASKCLSSCSMSSQDTITTGSGIHPHSPNAASGSHQRRHSMDTGTPIAALRAAAADVASRSSNPGLTPCNTMQEQNNSSSCTWQLSTGSSNESVGAKAWAVQPGATAAGDKTGLPLPAQQPGLMLPDVQQLINFSSLQQQYVIPQQPQVIQVNYVHGSSPTCADATATAADFSTNKDPSSVVVQSDALHTATLQDLIPSVAASKAAVGVGAAAAVLQMDRDGGGSSNGSSRGGKRSNLGKALSRLRSASRSFASRNGSRSFLQKPNEHLLGFTGKGSMLSKEAIVRTRVEPKTFFANERTFLQWLNISVLVMMTGLGLLGGSSIMAAGLGGTGDASVTCMSSLACSSARISGAIIAAVSVLFMLYALYIYKKRTRQILSRSTLRYDDQTGPVLLTLLLAAVTVLSLALAIHAFRSKGLLA